MALVFVVIGLFLFGMLELFEWKDAQPPNQQDHTL